MAVTPLSGMRCRSIPTTSGMHRALLTGATTNSIAPAAPTLWGDRQTLESFHVHYFNGNACVRTTDDGRRQQFLFERREEQEGYFSTLVARLNIPQFSTPAVAGPEVLKYEKLHVLLGNYKKKPLTSGCVSFSVPAQGSALDIVLSDIEDNVLHNSVAPTKTWSLNVY